MTLPFSCFLNAGLYQHHEHTGILMKTGWNLYFTNGSMCCTNHSARRL